MKIFIASAGRSWLLELARELAILGHEVSFFSFTPAFMCERFGLERKYVKGFFLLSSVIEFFCRKLPWKVGQKIRNFNRIFMDYSVSVQLAECDVFIGISGYYVKSLITAKKKYGAVVLVDRGCKHIQEQYDILRRVDGAVLPLQSSIRRELVGYQLADYIVIPSEHAYQSFLKHGISRGKLFTNPYGVSLTRFSPTEKPVNDAYDVIMVGQWSYRKGCDIIAEACKKMGIRFLHVGAIIDLAFPEDNNFTHIYSVDEKMLIEYYSQAKVFVLPSREDGFGLVLAQALICGLPIVCSKDTGGSDLRNFLSDKKWIIVMEETTVECLIACIRQALSLADSQPIGKRNYTGEDIENLTWEAYGKRYEKFLYQIIKCSI
jgi:glycosyltransferase involved in cell wall biosynthesis